MKSFLYLFVLIAFASAGGVLAQDLPDALPPASDTLAVDSIAGDTLAVDSATVAPRKEPPFKTRIKYKAADSITFKIQNQRAFLYKETQVNYENIELTAYETEFDMATRIVYAKGGKDSIGADVGLPVFKEGEQPYEARSLAYNFGTKKGTILEIKTQQGEGIMHATKSKRYPDGHIDMQGGMYTTCDADHPHFGLKLSKAKVIPGDQVVFGPAQLYLLDIPMPLVLPFGFFPQNNKKAVSGILPPTIGMEVARGLNLTNGGYYFAFNDNFDATMMGDIYSTGTWKTNLQTRYIKRYKFSGNVNFNYGVSVTGEKGLDQSKTKQYSLQWTHTQDAKANPSQSFSANVNYSSTSYDSEYNYTSPQAVFSNNKSSSLNFSKSWPNRPFRISTSALVNQQSDGNVQAQFPNFVFGMDRIYPFRKKESAGKAKWYEDIMFQYDASLQNTLTGEEGDLFSEKNLKNMRNGFQHRIPFSINFKALRFFNITPSLNYSGVMYASHIEKSSERDALSQRWVSQTDTIWGASYAHALSPSLSVSANPKFYLMNVYGPNSKVEAIRTVISPTASVSYVPDLSKVFNYYREYTDSTGRVNKYSMYEGSMYSFGTPSAPGQSGSVSVGINGNVEMKVRSDNDSTGESRKIKIIDRIDARSSYNMFADSMKWSMISLSASTTVFGLNLTLSGTVDPYKLTPDRRRIDQFGPRLTAVNFNTGISLPLTKKESGEGKEKDEGKTDDPYAYFDVPWSLSLNYTFGYAKPYFDPQLTQNVSISGNITLTPKWTLNFQTSYDVEAKKIAYTTASIQRDLHCWQMSFNFSPFGEYKYFNFLINVKSSTLQDLKYEKKKNQYDYTQW